MYKTLFRTLVAFFVLAFSSTSTAGFLFEPYASYGVQGDYEQGSTEGDVSVTNFGARLGFEFRKGFQIGADVMTGAGNLEFDGGGDVDFTPLNLGLTLGMQARGGFRAYGTYFLQATNTFDDATDTVHTGEGFKLGIGFRFNRYVAANFEYQALTYDEFETSAGSGTFANEAKVNTLMVVLSFPFNFGRGR